LRHHLNLGYEIPDNWLQKMLIVGFFDKNFLFQVGNKCVWPKNVGSMRKVANSLRMRGCLFVYTLSQVFPEEPEI
jgi:hypothetical protein